jgi:signal peptidase II
VFVPAGVILLLDQWSKKLALERLHARVPPAGGQWPQIRLVSNTRVGLGLLCDRRALIVLWAVAVVGSTLLVQMAAPFHVTAAKVGLGAAVGGATGNLIDAVWRGAVVDFIDLRFWPVFNLADASIVLGVAITLWSVW